MNAENACSFLTAALVALTIPRPIATPKPVEPVTVAVKSGNVTLHALLWRPEGPGPFPAVLVNHGSGRTREELERLGPYERQADTFAPVFAQHGYVLLFLFREGVGLSSDVGRSAIDLMTDEAAAHGQDARNALQMKLLEGRELTDALAGLAFLRGLADVDPRRIAVVGHSLVVSLTVPDDGARAGPSCRRRILGRGLQLGPVAGPPRAAARSGAPDIGPAVLPPRGKRLLNEFRQGTGRRIDTAGKAESPEDLSTRRQDA